MSNILDMKFLIGIFLLMAFPLSNAYYEALRMAQLPKKQHAILGVIAMFTTITAMNMSFILIGQVDDNSFSLFNLIPVLLIFFLGRVVRKKFPDLFLKFLLKNNLENVKR